MSTSNPVSAVAAKTATSGTTLVCTSFTPAVGATLIVSVAMCAATTGTLSISSASAWQLTWTKVATTPGKGGTSFFESAALFISSPVPSNGGAGTITVTSSTTITLGIAEYYYVTGAGAVGATGVFNTPATTAVSPFSVTLSSAPKGQSLVVSAMGNRTGTAPTFGAPTGWTSFTRQALSSLLYEQFSYLNTNAATTNQWTDTAQDSDCIAVAEITAANYPGSVVVSKPTTSGSTPTAVDSPGGCYHPTTGLFYYFGGVSASSETTGFYSYDPVAQVWTTITTAHTPSARADFTMGYDPVSAKIVGFGGYNGSVSLADTWTIDPTAGTPDWTQLTPATSPALRSEAGCFYHPTNGQFCVYGGNNASSTFYDDLWTWTGTNWSELSTALTGTGRSAPLVCTMNGHILLFGGYVSGNVFLSDTWTWNGTTATQLSPATVPAGRGYSGFMYHPPSGNVLMHGGLTAIVNLNDLWLWNGTNWIQQAPSGVALNGLTDQQMLYSPANQMLVEVFGLDIVLLAKTNEVWNLAFGSAPYSVTRRQASTRAAIR